MQAVTGRMRDKGGPARCSPQEAFFLILLRLQNVVILAPVVAAGLVVPAWWNKRALAAIVCRHRGWDSSNGSSSHPCGTAAPPAG